MKDWDQYASNHSYKPNQHLNYKAKLNIAKAKE